MNLVSHFRVIDKYCYGDFYFFFFFFLIAGPHVLVQALHSTMAPCSRRCNPHPVPADLLGHMLVAGS